MASMTTAEILDSIEESNNSGRPNADSTFYFVHVHKDRAQSALGIENPRFVITLHKTKAARLGFKFDLEAEEKSLFIKEIVSGLAFTWNKANKDKRVRAGDAIVRINGVTGDAKKLFEESKSKAPKLEIEIHRGTSLAISAGLSITLKQKFGAFGKDAKGSVLKVDDDGDACMKIGKYRQWVNKKDYDKFLFEDSDRFYLKRYVDFQELNYLLKKNVASGEGPIKMLEDLPEAEKLQFRRSVSAGQAATDADRQVLQKYTDTLLKQAQQLDTVPALADFFGERMVPDVGARKEHVLKQRLDMLVTKWKGEQQEADLMEMLGNVSMLM